MISKQIYRSKIAGSVCKQRGQFIVELLVAIGLMFIILPTLTYLFIAAREGKPEQDIRVQAGTIMQATYEAMRSVRERGWTYVSSNGTYHPAVSGSVWTLVSGADAVSGLSRSIVISDVYRDQNGAIVASGSGTIDPSMKQVTAIVGWTQPRTASIQSSWYITRYIGNTSFTQTTATDFTPGTFNSTQVTNTAGGEVTLGNNNKAKWCTPAFSTSTIDLPDGPPVAVAATASAVITTPNDVFVATAPEATTSVKLAYLTVTANTDIPIPTLHGTFTLDPSKYSSPSYVPTGIGITNSFKTTDVKWYKSPAGKLYAILGTDMSDHEVIAIQITNGTTEVFQDPVNKIYKYATFFNTKQYPASNGNDQAPFGYGASAITILGNTGYLDSGGYVYTFDLSAIDSKTASVGLNQIGCRILLDGYDCQPNNGTDKKYAAGETGTTWSDTTSPAHLNCSDGGNIELNADHQLSAVAVSGKTYVYVAVGAGTNPELDVVDVSTVPTGSTLSQSSCGRGTNTGWKKVSSLDFNPANGTEEAANSVYAKSDGTRAYLSSNGGIVHNGIPDSDQFYIIDTTNKASPKFISTWASTQLNPTPGHYANTASSGFYNGDSTNIELYPRRALTVLNGQRAILVGQDGIPNDGIEPKEYQVINIDPNDPSGNREASPSYCGGLNFIAGFNDLTSVSEADGDNFVYMVANTMEKQLKIVQGGPDTGIYLTPGTFESKTFAASNSSAFNRFSATISQSAQTSVKVQVAVAPTVAGSCSTASFSYVGPNASASAYFTPVGTTIAGAVPYGTYGGYQNPSQCFRYKVYMDTTDTNQTPVLYDMTVNYSP